MSPRPRVLAFPCVVGMPFTLPLQHVQCFCGASLGGFMAVVILLGITGGLPGQEKPSAGLSRCSFDDGVGLGEVGAQVVAVRIKSPHALAGLRFGSAWVGAVAPCSRFKNVLLSTASGDRSISLSVRAVVMVAPAADRICARSMVLL